MCREAEIILKLAEEVNNRLRKRKCWAGKLIKSSWAERQMLLKYQKRNNPRKLSWQRYKAKIA